MDETWESHQGTTIDVDEVVVPATGEPRLRSYADKNDDDDQGGDMHSFRES